MDNLPFTDHVNFVDVCYLWIKMFLNTADTLTSKIHVQEAQLSLTGRESAIHFVDDNK